MDIQFIVARDLNYYAAEFIRSRGAKSLRTREWYRGIIERYREATTHLPDWPPAAEHLLCFIDSFDDRRLTPASRYTYYNGIRIFFNWCHKHGYIAHSPIDEIDAPRKPRLLPKAPWVEDMDRLFSTIEATGLEHWRDTRDLALFSLALDTGARIGELARLQVDDADLLRGTIYVWDSKTSRDRRPVLSDPVAGHLAAWLSARAEKVGDRFEHLFAGKLRGKWRPFTPSGMRQRLEHWQVRAGVKHFNFHAFRHAYAVYSLRNGADLLDIKEQLGHASIKTTAIYTEVVGRGRLERHRDTSPYANLLTEGVKSDKINGS
jgi:site-specific recombinase XerD